MIYFWFSSAEWQALNDDANKPLTNRFRGTYSGSSMKPITAAIGLESTRCIQMKILS
ncbi:MAG: hypothetical protein ACLRQF_03730 [Thomasclavelia ramosa]